ncbi:MAG: spermidine synthase [Planctomycetota bacterium]|jgi:spermidine synthase
MKSREVLDTTKTADGSKLELSREADGHFVIRVAGVPLMSSATYGSEVMMAVIAKEMLGNREDCRILIGGLGMGFTCRAALDEFGKDARMTVAELLPQIVTYNRGPLGHLAENPLDDQRMQLFEGDVRTSLIRGNWNAVLLDVDNGPSAVTTLGNKRLYSRKGVAMLAKSLAPGGVLIVWSADECSDFAKSLEQTGLTVTSRRVFARAPLRKGAKHTLVIGTKARGAK